MKNIPEKDKPVSFSIRIKPDLYKRILKNAMDSDRPVNWIINNLCQKALDKGIK